MVDKEKFNEIIDKEHNLPENYPWYKKDIWEPMLESLGKDEDDIIKFMDNADKETLSNLFSIYDDIMDKFPSEKMDKAIDRYLENYQKVFDVKFNK